MRLAIAIGCLITLIFVSRWLTLSRASEPELSFASSITSEPSISDDQVAPAIFDQELPLQKPTAAEDLPVSLGAMAKNVQKLVRAEYEVTTNNGKVLMDLKSRAILEINELPCEDPDRTRIQVTTDLTTQQAICSLLGVIDPKELPRNQTASKNSIEEQQLSRVARQ